MRGFEHGGSHKMELPTQAENQDGLSQSKPDKETRKNLGVRTRSDLDFLTHMADRTEEPRREAAQECRGMGAAIKGGKYSGVGKWRRSALAQMAELNQRGDNRVTVQAGILIAASLLVRRPMEDSSVWRDETRNRDDETGSYRSRGYVLLKLLIMITGYMTAKSLRMYRHDRHKPLWRRRIFSRVFGIDPSKIDYTNILVRRH